MALNIDFTLTNLDKTLTEFLGFEVPNQPDIQDINDWAIAQLGDPPIVQHQNKQAFDKLWEERQEIALVVHRVRRDIIGHKLAISEIEKILGRIE